MMHSQACGGLSSFSYWIERRLSLTAITTPLYVCQSRADGFKDWASSTRADRSSDSAGDLETACVFGVEIAPDLVCIASACLKKKLPLVKPKQTNIPTSSSGHRSRLLSFFIYSRAVYMTTSAFVCPYQFLRSLLVYWGSPSLAFKKSIPFVWEICNRKSLLPRFYSHPIYLNLVWIV